jgi:asparagine synthase (glutamine-hydrolysing)
MCGIAGFVSDQFSSEQRMQDAARCLAGQLIHRGPDDEGVWVDPAAGIALAHRRLSILDLSAAGHQPMLSACGRYVVVFNGEIYNHLEIRRELDNSYLFGGHTAAGEGALCQDAAHVESSSRINERFRGGSGWRGHSDTETLLAAIAVWGLERTLQKTVGMFAIALWDREERVLYLSRDRMGEKPLYYGLQGGTLLFASELKALRAYPGFRGEVDRQALTLLLRYNAIPAPYSIYQGIFKLLPGTVLKITQLDVLKKELPVPRPYWSLRKVAVEGQQNPFAGSDVEAREELERLLRQSIAGQMIADVPLGAFLSGGIDSSTVVALMQAQSARPVQTFTIGFHESGYNEAEHAHAVAAYLGTDHTELFVTPAQAMAVIPRLQEIYDEPFADPSQIPTFLVSELARRHVTVSLSGDGGDELFGGYNRYVRAASLWRRMSWLPHSVRAALAGVLTTIPPAFWNRVFYGLGTFLPSGWRYANPGDLLHKLAEILAVRSPEEIYMCLVSHWKRPTDVVKEGAEPTAVVGDRGWSPDLPDLEHRMMYLDSVSYLPNDILVKVDRAAMGVSLETRVPFLDHRLVEFAWQLPLSMKIRDGQGKWLVCQVLDRHVPRKLIERPKMGFGIPLDVWLRGPLKGWAEDMLDVSRLAGEGFFIPDPIQDLWREHLSGKRNRSSALWGVLMFQQWLSAIEHR